jgi:hypothetical protein
MLQHALFTLIALTILVSAPAALSQDAPPDPPLILAASDDFDSADASLWLPLEGGWDFIPGENGWVLRFPAAAPETPLASTPAVTFANPSVGDAAVQARFSGSIARISLGGYTAWMDAFGLVYLNRFDVPLSIAIAAPPFPGQWRTLRLSAVQGTVRVLLEGIEVIALVDSEPMPPGTITLSGDNTGLMIDDFELWTPAATRILRSPPDTTIFANVAAVSPTLCWHPVADTPAYDVQIARDAPFTDIAHEATAVSGPCYTVTTALGHGSYFWRVSIPGESDLLPNYWRFSISPSLPPAPTFPNVPPAQTFDTTPLLTWNAAAGNVTYEVQVDNQMSFTSPEFARSGIAGTSQEANIPTTGTYYWRVRAVNEFGAPGPWSRVQSFRLG